MSKELRTKILRLNAVTSPVANMQIRLFVVGTSVKALVECNHKRIFAHL